MTPADPKPQQESVPAAGEAPPVDLVHLHRYTLGNAALDREVLDLFRDTAPGYLEALHKARERKAWVEAAHAIKGSARAIGAWKVGVIAERLERLPGAPDAAEGIPLIAELSAEIDAVARFIAGFSARA